MLILLGNQVVLSFHSLQSNAIQIEFSSIKVRVCLIDLLSNGWKLSNQLWSRDSLQTSDRFLLALNDGQTSVHDTVTHHENGCRHRGWTKWHCRSQVSGLI